MIYYCYYYKVVKSERQSVRTVKTFLSDLTARNSAFDQGPYSQNIIIIYFIYRLVLKEQILNTDEIGWWKFYIFSGTCLIA